jgi:hypothetical protein
MCGTLGSKSKKDIWCYFLGAKVHVW